MGNGKNKQRLDTLLLEKKIFASRNRARAEIMSGNVFVNGKREDKPGAFVALAAQIELRNTDNPYVSRGGLKLEKALTHFAINLRGKILLDLGASTGGFTQCALAAEAKEVYALDVGYGQLDWKLRNDPRVTIMERCNARYLKKEALPQLPDVATVDVSFISLKKIIPAIAALQIAEMICLVKPQFEASPEQVGKKGVIKDPQLHEKILKELVESSWLHSYKTEGLTYSPIKGPKGNIEYFLYLGFTREDPSASGTINPVNYEEVIQSVVAAAWQTLHERL